MKVLALARYGPVAASARYRMFEMVPRLASEGITLDVQPLLPDAYVRSLRVRGAGMVLALARAYVDRVAAMLRSGAYDAVFVQYEALPWVPAALEQALYRRDVPLVLDYDDAWHHRYQEHRSGLVRALLGGKIPALVRAADAVVVGSRYLEAFAQALDARVVRIPTSIELERYPRAPRVRDAAAPPVIGWIGSPATAPYLAPLAEPLRAVAERTGARVTVIGAPPGALAGPHVEVVPWSAASEVALLDAMDVGIMPVPDEPFARGKCAFKLIQYMGAWKPVVASPVGENQHVVAPGENGWLATSAEEWQGALERVLTDPAAAAAMGRAGRARVEAGYTQAGAARTLAQLLRDVVGGAR
jgi:glycosyltransferase involved in cell wall biosynthesis